MYQIPLPTLEERNDNKPPVNIGQAALIFAGGVTQLLTGSIPTQTSIGDTARNFNRIVGFIPNFSEESQGAIQSFGGGVILANHPNSNMADFPSFLSLMDEETLSKLRIGTGETVTPMYSTLFPQADIFLAEGQNRQVHQGVRETISCVQNETHLALLPYFEELQAVHTKVLQGVQPETPVLEIKTHFPFPIDYIRGKDRYFGEDTIYGRLFAKRIGRPYDSIQVEIEAHTQTAGSILERIHENSGT